MKKKLISVLLALTLCLAMCVPAFAAGENWTDYPVIVVPGYSSSAMYRLDENGNKIHVWGIDTNEILAAVLKNIAQLGIGIGALTTGNANYIADLVGREFYKLYYDMACNPDGSSVYDLKRYCVTAEESNSANLEKKYGDTSYQHEAEIMGEYANYIGKKNIFNFNCDFRMGAVFCAGQLDEFIQSVKEYTGKDKVNLFAVSHGGQVTGTYLTLYGQKGDVNNAVMTVPALGGAGIAYDLMNEDIHLDEEGIAVFVQHGMMEETDYNWLLKANELGFLDKVLDALVPHIKSVMGYWGSIWDFIPTEYYEQMKKENLDPVKSAALIEKSDYMHYTVMPDFANGFKRAQAAGTDVFIVAGYDNKIVTGLEESSDAIITIKASTGATAAPLGKRFSDGYTQKVNTGFYQVSPSMTLDASTSFLPEHTWFVENFYHGMIYKDPFTAELLKTLLLTEKIKNVHSDPAFPQFHATTNKSHSVFATFDKGTEGYVTSESKGLVVKNLSEKYPMLLTAITAKGVNIKFSGYVGKELKPGESVTIPYSGELDKVSKKNFEVVVGYVLNGSITPIGERTFNFTLMNGKDAVYDPSKPYTTADVASDFSSLLSSELDGLFTSLGLKPFLEIIFNVVQTWLRPILDMLKKFASIGVI